MFEILFFIIVGILIGWNLPQPHWAKELQDKTVAKIRDLMNQSR